MDVFYNVPSLRKRQHIRLLNIVTKLFNYSFTNKKI